MHRFWLAKNAQNPHRTRTKSTQLRDARPESQKCRFRVRRRRHDARLRFGVLYHCRVSQV